MDTKALKVIGVVTSIVGTLATMIAEWAGAKRQDAVIAEKVTKAVGDALGNAVKKD